MNGIFTDEYKPNQIINEQELVQKFGCSKTPIREALVTLCNEGILAASRASAIRSSAYHARRHRISWISVSFLKADTSRQSIGNITEENLAELAEIDERCKQSTDSVLGSLGGKYSIPSEADFLFRQCLRISGA